MNAKSQIPNAKRQINPNLQILSLRFGAWSFFGVWDLVFGTSTPVTGKTPHLIFR